MKCICRTQKILEQLGLEDYAEVNIQVLGAEDTYGPHAVDTVGCLFLFCVENCVYQLVNCPCTIRTNNLQLLRLFFIVQSPREAVVWMAVHHKQKKALEFFSREVAPAGTGMGEQKPKISFVLLFPNHLS